MQPIFKLKREELPSLPRYKDLLLYKHLLPEDEKLEYTENTLKKINNAIRKRPNELDLDEYYSDLLSSVIINLQLFKSEKGKDFIQDDNLKLFYENNSSLISDSNIEIYHRLCFFSSNPNKIKNDCYWDELYQLQNKYKDSIYEYNSRKMKKLESMIKIIQENKEHFQIWNTEYQ